LDNFLVLKILDSDSVSLPASLIYCSVELRPYSADSECEIEVLKESASNNRAIFEKYSYCARIATIVESDSIDNAIHHADKLFSEILDLKSVEFAISNFRTSDIGYVKNLESGNIQPIRKTEYMPSMSFMTHQGSIQRVDAVNYLSSLNNELSERYKRSLHWVRNSKHEQNRQLKTLFYWFAIEALVKETDTDNIGGVVRWALGFPNGKNRNSVSSVLIDNLSSHPKYAYWNKELIAIIDNIRVFRNDSVHSGFRSADFTKKELELYSQIMTFGASRCQAAVQQALINGLSTVSEFKEYISIIFEENINVVNDVHGTILFSLERTKNA
jgi:hypothetical protein